MILAKLVHLLLRQRKHREHPQLAADEREARVSRGDPLTYGTKKLESILSKLRAIPHLEIIRIGSRVPVSLPMRVTDELCEMLSRYHGDERICMVSGDNFQGQRARNEYSYYFSRYTHIWGWATWRRAWRLYDHRMTRWPELRETGWLSEMFGERTAVDYWRRIFDETHDDRNSSWAYRWTFSAWEHGALTILPNVNLVSNIGFGAAATHTLIRYRARSALPVQPMEFPLKHPPACIRDEEADAYTQLTVYARSPWWRRLGGEIFRLLRGA